MDLYRHRCFLALIMALSIGAVGPARGQLSTSTTPPTVKTEPTITADSLGRDTPRGAMMSFLKWTEREDYSTAAHYLQPVPKKSTDLEQCARELAALLQKGFTGNLALLSDDAAGNAEPGLPPGQIRAGLLDVGGMTANVILVRVDDPTSGKVWLISQDTVATIPELYAHMEREEPTWADRIMPATLTERRLLGMSLAQWLSWLLSIPISWLLARLFAFLISLPALIANRLRKLPLMLVWLTPLGTPLKCIVAILIHCLLVYLLGPPLLYRAYYFRFMAILLVASFAWLVSRSVDRGFESVLNRARKQQKGGESILILMQRLNRIFLLVIAVVVSLALLGFDVRTTLAGLGIGGVAIALAAQKTLENVIGGVSLLMDKAVHVGDFCQIGNQLGSVEDIGLRSLKLRTLDQSLLVVPNGLLAQMEFQNLTHRGKLLINQTFSLRIETRTKQLYVVLDRVQKMLDQHPLIEPGSSRVRVTSLAGAAFGLELFAYVKTGDWMQFTVIRQDLILKIAEIVEGSGTGLAAPTQLAYLCRDKGANAGKADNMKLA